MKTKQPSAPVAEPATKVINKVDFSSKQLQAGIDVHKKRWQVAVFYEGLISSNDNIAANTTELITCLHMHYACAAFSGV